jgi:hypothetical protein
MTLPPMVVQKIKKRLSVGPIVSVRLHVVAVARPTTAVVGEGLPGNITLEI